MRISGRFSSSGFHAREELRIDKRIFPFFALIHGSAWKGNSANFALPAFCELRVDEVLGSSSER